MPWFAPVLGKIFKMSETAAITPLPDAEEKEPVKMTEDRIVKSLPRTYQATANKLIGHLKDYSGVSWNAKIEMVVDRKLNQAVTSQFS